MQCSVERFLALPFLHDLSNKERFIALLWLHQYNGNKDFISFKSLQEDNCKAYPAVNPTTIKKALSADKRTSSKEKGNFLKLTTKAIHELDQQYIKLVGENTASKQTAKDLRAELENINNDNTKAFVEEAISCLEYSLYRSAIVMSWIAAMDVLHNHIYSKHLQEFNKEAKRINNKWKIAKTTDDLGRMGEAEFLERICTLSIIGKNTKAELKNCLDRRNGCGHPNSLKLASNTVAHHIEILILNVFNKFV